MKKRLAASNMGYGRTFSVPEDLAYLKQVAKEILGEENKWPDLKMKISGRPKKQEAA